ncbi:MAG: thiamine phosphate synthase [Candidatus Aminicenantia bacterium]
MKRIEWDLYLVTDRKLCRIPFFEMIKEAVRGGITALQLREKEISTRDFIEEALKVKELIKGERILFIINDRVDIALAVDADGVHLGNEDMPVDMARKILGKKFIIGASAHSVEEAIEKERMGVNYIAVSPVFSTPTKPDAGPPLGLEGIKEMRKFVRVPLIGIGGINKENIEEVIKSGADGVAVVSAIVSAENPYESARELRELIKNVKRFINFSSS